MEHSPLEKCTAIDLTSTDEEDNVSPQPVHKRKREEIEVENNMVEVKAGRDYEFEEDSPNSEDDDNLYLSPPENEPVRPIKFSPSGRQMCVMVSPICTRREYSLNALKEMRYHKYENAPELTEEYIQAEIACWTEIKKKVC